MTMKKKMIVVLFAVLIAAVSISFGYTGTAYAAEAQWLWPVPSSTQINQRWNSEHGGLDIGGAHGCDIVASKSGTVLKVLNGDQTNYYGYGRGVVINHGDGWYSHYAHMNSTCVSEGQYVSQGQVIGTMGATGNATGTHLHFAIKTGSQGPFGGPKGAIDNNKDVLNYIYSVAPPTPQLTIVNLGDNFNASLKRSNGSVPIEASGDWGVKLSSGESGMITQDWNFERQSDQTYVIRTLSNGRVINIDNASTADGTSITLYNAWDSSNSTGVAAQRWYICDAGSGYYYLVSKLDTTKYLTVNGNGNIVIQSRSNSVSQTFSIGKFDYVGPKKISISGADSIEVGKTATYTVDYGNATGRKGVKWSVNDTSIASVNDNGEVTGIKNGTVTLKAVSTYNPNVTATKEILVQTLHNYVRTVIKEATCEETGTVKYTCTDCDYSYTEEIEALGHDISAREVSPSIDKQGYTIHTCSRCGYSYKDNYTDAITISEDGYIYSDSLPSYVKPEFFTIEYKSCYEKNATSSPGAGWVQGKVVSEKWVNDGSTYDTLYQETTSDAKVLVEEHYFHFCGPSTGAEVNYEQTDRFPHYDAYGSNVSSRVVDNDNGFPVYFIYANGSDQPLYCQSGVTCDGSYGSHGQRGRAWYKMYTYQNRKKIVTYQYTKESEYSDQYDSAATRIKYRYKPFQPSITISKTTSNDGSILLKGCMEAYGVVTEYFKPTAHGFMIIDETGEVIQSKSLFYTEFDEEGCFDLKINPDNKYTVVACLRYENANGENMEIYSDPITIGE